jgi:hypothetical protein
LRIWTNQSIRSDLCARANYSIRSDLCARANYSIRSDLCCRSKESVGSDLCCRMGCDPRGPGIGVRCRHHADDHTCWCCNSSYYPYKSSVHFKSLQLAIL